MKLIRCILSWQLIGGPSSSCDMIILRNNSHGGIIRVCRGIFTTALRNKQNTSNSQKKKTSPYFHSVSFVIWPLTLIKRAHFSELFILRFSTFIRKALECSALGFSYERWKRRNGELAKMRPFHQRKRSDNKRYAVVVRWGIFFLRIWRIIIFLRAAVNIPHTNSYNSAMTVIAQDDHLTAGAWATCGQLYVKFQEPFPLNTMR